MSTQEVARVDAAREKKCQRMAVYFVGQLIRTVCEQGEEQWKHAAACAGVNIPSPESQERIIDILKSLRPATLAGWGQL